MNEHDTAILKAAIEAAITSAVWAAAFVSELQRNSDLHYRIRMRPGDRAPLNPAEFALRGTIEEARAYADQAVEIAMLALKE